MVRKDVALLREGPTQMVEASTVPKEIFIVPYKRNVHFTGREKLIATLCTRLSGTARKQWNHQVALYGLGGIGKTQLALEYAYSHKEVYQRVFWISAATKETLWSDFQLIGGSSGCVSNSAALQPQEAAERVLQWLNAQDKWLLILDNLDTIDVVDGYLPNVSPNKHILITTRNQHVHQIPAEGLEVTAMDVDDAVELLITRANVEATIEKNLEAAKIVAELGRLPLAIEQAAAFIRESSKDIFGYLTSYQRNRQRHHAQASKANRTYYPHSVATTWHMSLEQVEKENTDPSQLLRLLAFLNPDGILTEFLEAGKDGLDGALNEIISDNDRLNGALGELERFSFIRRQADALKGQRITVHRLLQSVVKDEMSEELWLATVGFVTSLCNAAFPTINYGDLEIRTLSRRFQDQVVLPITAIQVSSIEFGYVLRRVGCFLEYDGKYEQAIEILTRSVETYKQIRGCEAKGTLYAMIDLAHAYRSHGRLEEDATIMERVVDVSTRLFGDDDPDTWGAMYSLALAYRYQGRHNEEIELAEKLSDKRRKVRGENDIETQITMGLLAEGYRLAGRLQESRHLGEQCLEAAKAFGENDDHMLSITSNLSSTYCALGQHEAALNLYEKVLEGRMRLFGPEHPETLKSMANLGSQYLYIGRFENAASLLEMSMEASARTLGPEHVHTLYIMMDLGAAYRDVGRLDESIALLEKAEAGLRVRLGSEHPNALLAMHYLASSYHAAGRVNDSFKLFEQVVAGRKKVLGEDHPDTRASLEWLQCVRESQRAGMRWTEPEF